MKYYFLAVATTVVVCVGCVGNGKVFHNGEHVAPPAERLHRPGPSVDLPIPAIMPPLVQQGPGPFATQTSQVRFVGPTGMVIGWQIGDGYAEHQLTAPGRYNFPQSATYRLKLADIPGRAGMTLYPTLQVYPAHPTTDAYLSHNTIPIEITDEDLDQVESNNFVTKVIYLPDAKFQELAIAGVETLVSTRLDPGVDPVHEADRRGTIMVILRLGNMDREMPANANGQGTPGVPTQAAFQGDGVQQVGYQVRQVDGEAGEFVPPVPVAVHHVPPNGIPGEQIIGGYGQPGRPAMHPVAGMGPIPSWSMPQTGTPIGLVGPPHLPFGREAGLKSHTVRDVSDSKLPKPVDHMLIDVSHDPGYSVPDPVKYIQYKEKHPVYPAGKLSNPAWNGPAGN